MEAVQRSGAADGDDVAPGLPLWLEARTLGLEGLASMELEHGMEVPHPTAAEEAAHAVTRDRPAAFHRQRPAERRHETTTSCRRIWASPAHTAASDQTLAAVTAAFDQRRRR